ncbi:hypothetical protein LINPERHAP2_LOCUS26167, partial [Linum perenne]
PSRLDSRSAGEAPIRRRRDFQGSWSLSPPPQLHPTSTSFLRLPSASAATTSLSRFPEIGRATASFRSFTLSLCFNSTPPTFSTFVLDFRAINQL